MSTIGVGKAFRDNARDAARRRARRQHTVDRQKERRDRHGSEPVAAKPTTCAVCDLELCGCDGLWSAEGLVCIGCAEPVEPETVDNDLHVAIPALAVAAYQLISGLVLVPLLHRSFQGSSWLYVGLLTTFVCVLCAAGALRRVQEARSTDRDGRPAGLAFLMSCTAGLACAGVMIVPIFLI